MGKAKTRRPLSTRRPIHLTLRSSKATGQLSLSRYRPQIKSLLLKHSARWNIRVYSYSINSNHIHLLIRGKCRLDLQNFFRTLSGLVARLITQAKKNRSFGKFWDLPLWTRLADWGRPFRLLRDYLLRNQLESLGMIPYHRKSPPQPLNTRAYPLSCGSGGAGLRVGSSRTGP